MSRKPAQRNVSDFFKGAADATRSRKAAEDSARARQEKEARQRARETARHARQLKKAFPAFYRTVEPFLRVLENLKPDADGNEFFIRTDLNLDGRDWETHVKGKEMMLWLVYAQQPSGQPRPANAAPDTHSIAFWEKGKDPATAERIDLLLNGLPVLQIEGKPLADGGMKFESEQYVTDFSYAPRCRVSGSYRGDWREEKYVEESKDLADMRAVLAEIGAWVSKTAPHRLPDIAAALNTQQPAETVEKLAVPRPIRLTKPQPGP